MSRFLFVAPPLAGHVNPMASIAARCAARGHKVAWAGSRPVLGEILRETAVVYPAGEAWQPPPRLDELRAFAALRYLWQDFLIPLADAMVPGVTAAVTEFAPDVLVVDQQAFAGALVASRFGKPWVTSASTSAELTDPLRGLPRVAGWISSLQAGLKQRHGVHGDADLRFSPHAVIVFSTKEFAGSPAVRLPGGGLFVGPALDGERPQVDFPWHRLSQDVPIVLVTLGTANGQVGRRFLNDALLALRQLEGTVSGVIADPTGHLHDDPNVVVVPAVPQLELLRRTALVVCHGGHNTVCESLSSGVPLVVAPIRDDQPVIAQQVVAAGAGVWLRFEHANADSLRSAIGNVLQEPSYAQRARAVAASFQRAGGSNAAADCLEAVSSRTARRYSRSKR